MSSSDTSPARRNRHERYDHRHHSHHHRHRHSRFSQPDTKVAAVARPRASHTHHTRPRSSRSKAFDYSHPAPQPYRLDRRKRDTPIVVLPSGETARVNDAGPVRGRGLRAGWMRRWRHGRGHYDDTYHDFNQVYNLVELLYSSLIAPDGRMTGGANLMTLGASSWLMWRKVLAKWLGNVRTTDMKKSTVLWYAFTMMTIFIAASRGYKDKIRRKELNLL